MQIAAGIVGVLCILAIFQDSFEAIILPRRVSKKFRLSRQYYKFTWHLWSMVAHKIRSTNRREEILSIFGPLSLILLLALWAIILIFSFALVQWSLGSVLSAPESHPTFGTDLYMSGTTFFTLGLGDVIPRTGIPRVLTIIEAGIGFAFLALIIGYVPIIYQAFSRRESVITLLDARAGTPSSAAELLRRHTQDVTMNDLVQFLQIWERWSSELLESHISYPVLCYYRSQHDSLSWLAALTTILDVSALVMVGLSGIPRQTGKFTFAIARHAIVDIAQILGTAPTPPPVERLSSDDFDRLRAILDEAGLSIRDENGTAEEKLASLRNLYEPYVNSLAKHLLLSQPAWIIETETVDDWQTSAWDHFALTSQRPITKAKKHIVDVP